jgi:hypothetical protein
MKNQHLVDLKKSQKENNHHLFFRVRKEEIARNITCWCRFCMKHSLGTFLHKTPGFAVNCCAKH